MHGVGLEKMDRLACVTQVTLVMGLLVMVRAIVHNLYLHGYIHTYMGTYIHTLILTYIHTYKPNYIQTYITTHQHTKLPYKTNMLSNNINACLRNTQ